jgi:hypothetical protein
MITTNLPFSEWTQVIPNARLCKVLLDRITDRAHNIETGADILVVDPDGSAEPAFRCSVSKSPASLRSDLHCARRSLSETLYGFSAGLEPRIPVSAGGMAPPSITGNLKYTRFLNLVPPEIPPPGFGFHHSQRGEIDKSR